MNWLMHSTVYKCGFYILFFFVFLTVNGQDKTNSELESLALEMFVKKEYVIAAEKFESLIAKYPKESSYNYYLGRCLLEINIADPRIISTLKYAASQNYNADVHFYLAFAYYLTCQAEQADVSLVNFKNLAKKKDLKEFGSENWKIKIQKTKSDCNKSNKEQAEVGVSPTITEVPVVAAVIVAKEPIVIKKSKPLTYDEALEQALEQQLLCDSLQTELESLNQSLRATELLNERNRLFSSISAMKAQIKTEQLVRDELFILADSLATSIKSTHSNSAVILKEEINGLKVYVYKKKTEKEVVPLILSSVKESSIKEVSVSSDKMSEFVILSSSPYSSLKPFLKAADLQNELVYRIQLGAFGKSQPYGVFGGLSPIFEEPIEERSLVKYYVGRFVRSKDARRALLMVKDLGYTDAFIVSYYNKKKISIHEAREIEFGQKSRIE